MACQDPKRNITKLNEKKVAKAGDTLSGSYQWNDSSGRTLHILKTDEDIAFGYGFSNAQGGLIACRSNTYGTAQNNSYYDGCLEFFARSGSNVSVATLFNDGSFFSRGIAFSVNSIGSNYIRFDNGIQIVWGQFGNITDQQTITFPVPFAHQYYGLVADKCVCQNWSNVSFVAGSVTSQYVSYICIGTWK